VVILRYNAAYPDLKSIGAGLTFSLTTSGGFKVYTFTAGTDFITV
jgi:hypothetical protein